MNRHYESLRHKLVLPFVLLGAGVSALLSLITYTLASELEERAIDRTLQVEMESFRNRRRLNDDALPPSAKLLQGVPLPSAEWPGIALPVAGPPTIVRKRLADGGDYAVLAAEVDGRPYALLYDRQYVDGRLTRLALYLLVASGAMTLLSYLVGNRLAAQVVRPIGKLVADLSQRAAAADPTHPVGGNEPVFSAADYPNNDIGRLVQALDEYALRLYGFVRRESYFAADVSHELRTPVAVVRGAAELLELSPDLPPAARQRAQTIHRQAIRMGELLEAMLILARERGEGEDPVCALADVVSDVVEDCRPSLAGRAITLDLDLKARPVLPVERSLVYVAVSNLARNACTYTREGRVALTLHEDRLEIADTGIGIPEDRFPTLFDHCSKGEGSPGSGIGLSIVARVARLLGWRVSIDSRPGEGTRVVLAFQRDPA